MNTMRTRCHPQRPWSCYMERGCEIVALDGGLRLSWRDPSLEWLPGGAPLRTLFLEEGGAHRFVDAVRIDVEADRQPSTALVLPPAPREPSAAGRWAIAFVEACRSGWRRFRQASAAP
jgi:hypothetical protein